MSKGEGEGGKWGAPGEKDDPFMARGGMGQGPWGRGRGCNYVCTVGSQGSSQLLLQGQAMGRRRGQGLGEMRD